MIGLGIEYGTDPIEALRDRRSHLVGTGHRIYCAFDEFGASAIFSPMARAVARRDLLPRSEAHAFAKSAPVPLNTQPPDGSATAILDFAREHSRLLWEYTRSGGLFMVRSQEIADSASLWRCHSGSIGLTAHDADNHQDQHPSR